MMPKYTLENIVKIPKGKKDHDGSDVFADLIKEHRTWYGKKKTVSRPVCASKLLQNSDNTFDWKYVDTGEKIFHLWKSDLDPKSLFELHKAQERLLNHDA